jgi:ABC-type nitrate/sulfonate/bicarbonate transport system permease component
VFIDTLRNRSFAPVWSVLLFLGAWHMLTPLLPTDLVPAPTDVFGFMWDEIRGQTVARTNVWQAFAISLGRLGAGFLIAFVAGLPVGLAMGVSGWVERMMHDLIVVGLAMPFLVWALLAGLWFGLNNAAPIATVVLAAAPTVVINTMEGVRDVPRDLTDMAHAFGVPRGRVVRHVVLPSLAPFMFASLRYGLANGWKGLLVAEIFAATSGAGWNIQYWYDAHRAHGVVGYALFFIGFALAVEQLIFQPLADRVFRWRPSHDVAQAGRPTQE